MRILTCAQTKKAEAAAVLAGTSYLQLMENAGVAAANEISAIARAKNLPHSILLFCGKGNNAGDAFVVARLLAQKNWQVQVLPLCGDAYSLLAQQNKLALPGTVQSVAPENANFTAAFLVDGVFGTGFKGPLPLQVQTVFATANAAAGQRVALDIPSGLECDSGHVQPGCFRADYTLTFGAYKPALVLPETQGYTGQVRCLDIGL